MYSHVRAFLASGQVHADKAARAPGSTFHESTPVWRLGDQQALKRNKFRAPKIVAAREDLAQEQF